MFKALVVDSVDGRVSAAVRELDESSLPAGDVTVAVEYSTINYKDGLVVRGLGGLVKKYPHVPGIDFAGTVLESRHGAYSAGDRVVLTGWRVGELQWGGYAEKASVRGDWLVPLPATLSTREAMAIGTAGFTAMLAVSALESQGLATDGGDVLVTGAAGGVGSVAVAILARRGYRVVASTGRAETADYLKGLGAAEVIDRSAFADPAKRPLETERWAGCVDSVGGNTLARVLAQTRYQGAVAAVGLAGGAELHHTVVPFLLRGVKLLGIDSVMCPQAPRRAAWARLCEALPRDLLAAMTVEAGLADVPRLAEEILAGRVRGRTVIHPR
ncbi:MAG: oxidoreductase [Gammaproteobacteria bacterium]|nr:oxidoreductase [Gammaproteobacteria bacterium]